MKRLTTVLTLTILAAAVVADDPAQPATRPEAQVKPVVAGDPAAKAPRPRVEIAILLDTSNSMDGLIAQAKSELWRIVNEFITAKREGVAPDMYVALYEYGNNRLSPESGFIRQVLPLTDDLDKVSQELFALQTSGGDEYCGQVIDQAIKHLKWSENRDDLKLIFIAGNEPFTQGPVEYTSAVGAAIARGVVVNTIHCGSYDDGVEGKWKDGALRADGSYTHIDQNKPIMHIAAPQDDRIAELGVALNGTYVPYGDKAAAGAANQAEQDRNALSLSPSTAQQRALSKANRFYKQSEWDLVDAVAEGVVDLAKIKPEDLPEAMRKMSPEQRKAHVEKLAAQRKEIQRQINDLNADRLKFIAEKEKERAAKAGVDTLDTALIKTLREQAAKRKFTFEDKPAPAPAPADEKK